MPHTPIFTTASWVGTRTDDPDLQALADHFVSVLRLSIDKALASTADPTAFPLPTAQDALETLLLRRIDVLDPETRSGLAMEAIQVLTGPVQARQARYGELAELAVNGSDQVADLAQSLGPADAVVALVDRAAETNVGFQIPAVPAMPDALAPQASGNTVELRLHEVYCVDETNPEFGHDDMYLQGAALDDRGGVVAIPAFAVGEFTEDAGEDTVAYHPPRTFASFDLEKLVTPPLATSGWPKDYAVEMVLVEKDAGGMGEWLAEFVTKFRQKIYDYVKDKAGAAAWGILVGAGLGSAFPGLGTLVGAAIGFVIGVALDALIDWIREWGKDDIFQPLSARLAVGGLGTHFNGSPTSPLASQNIEGHGGEYRVTWDWRINWADPWAGFQTLDGDLASAPSAARPSADRWDVFARGHDGRLWQKTFQGGWGAWDAIGSEITSAPAAVSWGPDRLDVFARRGKADVCSHTYWDGVSWHGWEDLGGVLTSAPAACSWGFNRVDIFARGTGGGCFHMFWEGKWHPWENIGGTPQDTPAAAAVAPNRLHVFYRDQNTHHLVMKRWDGEAWTDWTDLGGILSSAPAAASTGDGNWECVARGTDNRLWRLLGRDDEHRDWEPIGGTLSEAPGIVSRWDGQRTDYFVRDPKRGLRHRHIDWR